MTDLRLERWSEPVAPSGGMSAEGMKNTLGRPRMDLATLLVRETVQNSWDAGIRTKVRPISYSLDGKYLTGDMLAVLRESVFWSTPSSGISLEMCLQQEKLPVLIISDRGTSGLGGPTRAGVQSDEPTDFADFVRNVGQPPDKERGGGTYGFGKAVLYLASKASTILVYTRCRTKDDFQSRLIGIAWGDPYASNEGDGNRRLHTGRHWWGVRDSEAGIEPMTGKGADSIASKVGFPSFEDEQTGTSIMVIDPHFGEDSGLCEAIEEMKEALLWHCWPKMLGPTPDLSFTVSVDGDPVPVPDPSEHVELVPFVAAYSAAHGDEPSNCLDSDSLVIRCQRPKKDLGSLGVVKVMWDGTEAPEVLGRPFTPPPHHVALMRAPKLVVTYLEGPESPVPHTAWAGVFIADNDVDRAFAKAEPPSHDDWVTDSLPRSHEKTFVNVGLRRIREKTGLFVHPPAPISEVGEIVPLAGLASRLGGILASDTGPGTRSLPGETPTTNGNPGGKPTGGNNERRKPPGGIPRLEITDRGLEELNDQIVLRIRFRLQPASDALTTIVRARCSVAVNDGVSTEKEPPIAADTPQVYQWHLEDSKSLEEVLTVETEERVDGSVLILVPEDSSPSVSLEASTVKRKGGAS